MTPTERHFKREYALDLIQIARDDLRTAEALIQATGIRPELGKRLPHRAGCYIATVASLNGLSTLFA